MTPVQIAYVLASPLPLERPMDACWIACKARVGSSNHFALFARQNKRLIERSRNYADTMFLYRLTEEGAVRSETWKTNHDSSRFDHG